MKKGKILKMRIGLNPNSSSGYALLAFLFVIVGIGAFINFISSLIIATVLYRRRKLQEGKEPSNK